MNAILDVKLLVDINIREKIYRRADGWEKDEVEGRSRSRNTEGVYIYKEPFILGKEYSFGPQ